MKAIVICECTGRVREALRRYGVDAISCDLRMNQNPNGPHIQGDCRNLDLSPYQLVIFHPPCTHLSASGAHAFKHKRRDGRQDEAVRFFMWGALLPNEHVAVENPIGIMSSIWREADQIIQPWMFGEGECKATCLWLKNLPPLEPTEIVKGRRQSIHKMSGSRPGRGAIRSETFMGIAEAMGKQWSNPKNFQQELF